MAREEIDIKSVKKLNNSGKPKKSYSRPQPGKPKQGKSAVGKKQVNKLAAKGAARPTTGKASTKETTGKASTKPASARIPEEWLFLNAKTETIRELKEACEAIGFDVQYWPELGVIELQVDEDTCIDMESLDNFEEDEATTKYIKDNNIKLAMIVSVQAKKYDVVKATMKKISEKTDGKFCVDDGQFGC